jgi:cell division protein FtsW
VGTIRNGARSWFGIGQFGIQPSEAAKIVLIIYTAKYLANKQKLMSSFKKGMLPILIILLASFFLIMLQPDFGTAFIIIMAILGMLFVGGGNITFFKYLAILGLVGLSALILVAPYRIDRITSFINPWNDPLGGGFQIIQSMYAISPGGLIGRGIGSSIQKHFYLPEPQTDFIFSIISEELGILGVILICALYLIIIYRGLSIAVTSNDLFAKFLAFGITFSIAFQTLLNLFVVVGLIPVTGVTLPFISYGGSSLLMNMFSVGILLNISKSTQS